VTTAELKTRQHRANRFQKEQDKYGPTTAAGTAATGNGNKKKRQRIALSSSSAPTPSTVLSEFDLEQLIVVGTCQKVEKDYLRLTSAPAPNTVRPLPVLKQALKLVQEKWEKNKGTPECYVYMCSQLKSLRQDLVVQHIRNGKAYHVCPYFVCSVVHCIDLYYNILTLQLVEEEDL
jgi:SAC3 family protein LENG8/THP3